MPKFQHFGVLINIQANTWSLRMISTFHMWFLLKTLPFILQNHSLPFPICFARYLFVLFCQLSFCFDLFFVVSFFVDQLIPKENNHHKINNSQNTVLYRMQFYTECSSIQNTVLYRIQFYTEYSPIQNAALCRIQFYTEYSPIQRRTSSYCCKTFGKTFPFATISFITISHESLSTNLCPQGLKVIFKPPVNKIFPAPIINRQLLFIIYCLVLQLQIINN